MAMSKKYKYIAICATKFDRKKFEELTSGIKVWMVGDFSLGCNNKTAKDCYVYSLVTGSITDSYTEYLNTRFVAHVVDSVEDFASYIIAHALGTSLEELFNE